ncbi:MAG: NHLP bacteriocin system secretion protein [Aphanocapsa sp. GSE-SYN-MK-11-07L]|jgi:HlyD family secretion protein|nr:NHLP bacteriocin system secretion protein [Aphanocapsa sp. GSE-SYN-MK-11-07L]
MESKPADNQDLTTPVESVAGSASPPEIQPNLSLDLAPVESSNGLKQPSPPIADSQTHSRFLLKYLPWAILSLALVGWGVLGRIPILAVGRGVLIVPRDAVQLQSRAAGQVLSLNVEVGDRIQKGQVLAVLDQPVLRQQLLQLQANLAELEGQNISVTAQQNRTSLQRLQEIDRQRQALQQQRADLKQIIAVQKQKMDQLDKLSQEGAIARFDVERVKVEDIYLQNLRTLSNIPPQLAQLNAEIEQIRLQDTQDNLKRKNQIDDLKRQIKVVQSQITTASQILSDYTGQILDLTINPGQFVTAGTRLGTIGQDQVDQPLRGITFFAIADAKRIRTGMTIEITPDIESRERYGGILGQVTSVATLPATEADISRLVGNDNLAKDLVNAGTVIQVGANLAANPANRKQYQWTFSQGPDFPIQTGTTTNARIEVEQRTPLGYLLPNLRRLTGVYR